MSLEPRERDWPSIVESYRGLVEDHNWNFQPMLDLVKKIENSPYAQGTAPMTSMAALYIAQSNSGLNHFPKLRIEYDPENENFAFTYEDGYMKKKWWRRTVSSDEGFELLERFFLKRARWFKKSGHLSGQ